MPANPDYLGLGPDRLAAGKWSPTFRRSDEMTSLQVIHVTEHACKAPSPTASPTLYGKLLGSLRPGRRAPENGRNST